MSLQLQALASLYRCTKTLNPYVSHSRFLSPLSSVSVNFDGFFLEEKGKKTMKKLSVKCSQSDHVDQQSFNDSTFAATTGKELVRLSFVCRRSSASGFRWPFYIQRQSGPYSTTEGTRAPEFVSLNSGAFKLSKEGFVLLEFAPSAGVRQYDWSRKQVFSSSVTELGNLTSLGPRDSCEFFHDPFKGKSEEGKVRKVLKVEPLPDGSGHFFNLSVQNKLQDMDESIYIPVARAEFAVLVSAFSFILPYLMGWNAFVNSTQIDDTNLMNNANR